jgi:hypothetical protein
MYNREPVGKYFLQICTTVSSNDNIDSRQLLISPDPMPAWWLW